MLIDGARRERERAGAFAAGNVAGEALEERHKRGMDREVVPQCVRGGTEELHETFAQDSDFFNFSCNEFQANNGDRNGDCNFNNSNMQGPDQSLPFDETMFKDWTTNYCLEDNFNLDIESLTFLLDSDEWP